MVLLAVSLVLGSVRDPFSQGNKSGHMTSSSGFCMCRGFPIVIHNHTTHREAKYSWSLLTLCQCSNLTSFDKDKVLKDNFCMAIFEISQKTYRKLEGIYSPTLYRKLILRFVGCATLEGWLGKRYLAFPRLKLDGQSDGYFGNYTL